MIRVGFVLYHSGETKALLPTMLGLAKQSKKYELTIVTAGFPAKNLIPSKLKKYIYIPKHILNHLGQNDDYELTYSDTFIDDICKNLKKCSHVILGCAAKIQLQVAKKIYCKNRIIYFDGFSKNKLIDRFAKSADTLIFTDLYSYEAQKKRLDAQNINIKCARHGDFDNWLEAHNKNLKQQKKLRKKLSVGNNEKIILWIGGYGDLTIDDVERKAFAKFIKSFQEFKKDFSLRIILHPGVKQFQPCKIKKIINYYYLSQLIEYGFSKGSIKNSISDLDTNCVASIADAVVSLRSSAGKQAIYIGTDAKYVHLNGCDPIPGIESVKSLKRWREIFTNWQTQASGHVEDYTKVSKDLGVPGDISSEQLIREILG